MKSLKKMYEGLSNYSNEMISEQEVSRIRGV